MKVLYAVLATIVVTACVAPPAHAQFTHIVNLSVSGSGVITGSGGVCVAVDKPNGTITNSGCAPAFPLTVPQFISVQAGLSSPGGWAFVKWEGNTPCANSTAPVCFYQVNSSGSFTLRAIFEDKVVPVLSTPSGGQVADKDGTARFTWSPNEALKGAQCQVDTGPFVACSASNSHTVTADERTHTFTVKGTDISGNVGNAVTTNFRIVETALVSGPADISNDKSPSFTFSTVGGSGFDCSIDNVAVADCGFKGGDNRGSKSYSNLADGQHTFRVRAKDGPVTDPSTLVRTWKIDTVLPVASFGPGGPGEGALQAVNKETFTFASNEAGTLECRLDDSDFIPCDSGTSAVERLTAGRHHFDVRAIDLAGNVSTVVSRTWSVAASDTDNDGFNAQIDCNDGDPSIRPGAIEVLDNGIDENCDGVNGVTPPPALPPVVVGGNTKPEQVLVTLAFFSTAGKKTTKFTSLQIKNVPFGATVAVTCKGKGCPSGLKGKGFTKKNAFGTVTLAKFIKKPLKAKDVITVVVSKPNAISAVKLLTVRASKKPLIATKCQPPGAKSPVAC